MCFVVSWWPGFLADAGAGMMFRLDGDVAGVVVVITRPVAVFCGPPWGKVWQVA